MPLWLRRSITLPGDSGGPFHHSHRVETPFGCPRPAGRKDAGLRYDPSRSFRAWLKTLARHALSDFCDARGRGSQAVELLQSVEAREELVRQLEAEFDQEVLEEATARVRARVTPKSWRVFELTAYEGRSGAEAAEVLGMTVAAVFVAKSRVQKLLQDEVRQLEGTGSD